ncbi:hypothetical protein OBA39_02870 [Acidimicrobiaceae bacterium]|nr:hypothetical protein [Acidimicrobiaceae bacterium]
MTSVKKYIESSLIRKNLFFYLGLFLFTIITQNIYLNIETIEWDIASYLVASQGIENGLLPNQTQWESKGPIFIYLYYLLSIPAENTLVIFKLINDLILFLISLILFNTILSKTKEYTHAFFSSILFLSVMSQVWAQSGYSEVYSLLFLSISYFIITNYRFNNLSYLLTGILFSISSLINQGTVIFLLPLIISELTLNSRRTYFRKVLNLGIGFTIPHLFFLLLYLINGLIDIYLATYLTIPLGYVQANYASFYELFVFSRELMEYNLYLYLCLLSLIFINLLNLFKKYTKKTKLIIFDLDNLNVIFGLLFYFIGSHNYYHHLIYLVFFIPFMMNKINFSNQKKFIYVLILISSLSILQNTYKESLNNLTNINNLQQNYPLYNLAEEIDSYFIDDYDILAFDYNLILYYLNKPNFSYIVHPSNHFEEFIIEVLSDLDKVNSNYISDLINKEPDVIICNPRMIIRGIPTEISSLFNCEVSDYKKNYFKLDTKNYKNDENLNYYYDPYKEISVFIKKG